MVLAALQLSIRVVEEGESFVVTKHGVPVAHVTPVTTYAGLPRARPAKPDRRITQLACLLLESELRRTASREDALTQAAVSQVLEGVVLHELPSTLYTEAGLLPGPQLRSLDALHLAAAIRLGVDGVVTYDRRMAEAATELGMTVVAPA